jgi:arginyl-tRNA synthetase
LADDVELSKARLYLSVITKYVMKNGLTILGITAPEKMKTCPIKQ